MIFAVQPLLSGNALRLFLEPPAGATEWRVLRKGADTFTGVGDTGALVVYDGDERVIVDTQSLTNEQLAFYKAYYSADGGATWTASPTASGTPTASYQEQTTDVLAFLRDRLEAGLKVEVQRGTIKSDLGYIRVLTASPSLERDLVLPLITVHLDDETPSTRALGEQIADEGDLYGDPLVDSEGWIYDTRLTIIAWSLNSDERAELRRAIRRIILANMPVFADRGWMQIAVSHQDVDAISGEYFAPIYQVVSNFTCMAPVAVSGAVQPILDVEVGVTP